MISFKSVLFVIVPPLLSLAVCQASLAASGERKSISGWASCSGVQDDALNVARAFDAARHGAFTLVVDCPVRIHVGVDIARTVFIDDGTDVEFTGAGKFVVDNVFHPAFTIANSKDIVLKNWNVEYDASLPVEPKTGSYDNDSKTVSTGANAPPAGAFSDLRLSAWLTANRGVQFDGSQGHVASLWAGPTNVSAVFFLVGDTSNVRVTGMRVYAPANANGERFVPMVFSFSANYKSNQRVTAATPRTAQFVGVPHDLVFSDIALDGIYMGWQGTLQNARFEKIRAGRYSDLQDPQGGNVGGVGKWFAPPHLFYLNYLTTGDAQLFNRNIKIHDVVDVGPRVGTARDKGGSDSISGFDTSLKIGCFTCEVDGYTSTRPDGFIDVLSSDGLTISNVNATYDSSFLNDQFPGWRFPQDPYKNITFKNVVYKDLAAVSLQLPIGNSNRAMNEAIVFSNVRVEMNRWGGKGSPIPVIGGRSNDITLDYVIAGDSTHIHSVQKGTVSVLLQKTTSPDGAVALTWAAQGTQSCSAGGAWSGSLPPSGSRSLATGGDPSAAFTLTCVNGADTASTTLSMR